MSRTAIWSVATFGVLLGMVLGATPVFAQHGHHGGHGGGHHGGHFGGHGGGYYGGHGGHYGGHDGGHFGGHNDFHLDFGHDGAGSHYGHHGYHDNWHYDGHHYLPFHLGFDVSPSYGAYGYNSWYGSFYYDSWYGSPYDDSYLGYSQYYSPSESQGLYLDRRAPVIAQRAEAPLSDSSPRLAQRENSAMRQEMTPEALEYQRKAEDAFRSGRYDQTIRYANHGLVESPQNGHLYLLLAQALLAVGDYRGSAAATHQGISFLEEADWGYVVENFRTYYGNGDYKKQMERLNEYIKKNPDAAFAHFVRGYQYGFLGHREFAVRELNKVLELESRDELAAKLVAHFGGTARARTPTTEAGPVVDPLTSDRDRTIDGHSGHDHSDVPLSSPSPESVLSDLNVPPAVDATDNVAARPSNGATTDELAPEGLLSLSPADRAAALAQRTCPITGDTLGEMGTPIKVHVQGRDVFVCCKECVKELQDNPNKYLPK